MVSIGWVESSHKLNKLQVLAAGVGPAKMGIIGDAKNWEQHLEEFGFEDLKDWMIMGARDVGVTRFFLATAL